jgi:hypothetical protein
MTRRRVWWTLGVSAIAVIFVLTVGTSVVQFTSAIPEIKLLIETAEPTDRNVPAPTRELLSYALGDQTAPQATRLLVQSFASTDLIDTPRRWKATYILWLPLVLLCLSEDEQLTIVARLSPVGGGSRGLTDTSRNMFGRDLSALTLEETALLVALTREPSLRDRPERLELARNSLLARYHQKHKQ